NSSKDNKKDKKPLSKVVCYKCGEKGHIKRYCKNPKKKNQNSNKKDESANAVKQVDIIEITAMVSELKIGMIQELHMASVTTTADWWKNLVSGFKLCKSGVKAVIESDKVIGSGNVEIQFTSEKKLTLMNVLHVSNIRKNLVSGFKLCKSGVKAVIESDKAVETFKIYKAEVENQRGKKIQILRSDRGGEYFSTKFSSYCESQESSSAPRRSERARKERNLDPDFFYSKAIIFLVEGDNENNLVNKIPVLLNVEDAPKTYKEAITSRNFAFWKEAIDDEMDSLVSNNT
nr:retrotransposon protein, putative, Ty1-copia subclass [Tanacetum cinerariifolium]